MKGQIRTAFLAAAATTMLLSPGAALADDLKPQTRQDLIQAMEKEAYSVVKYRAFADHARKAGKIALAELLEQTASFEEQHFFTEARLFGLVSEDWHNLASVIISEYNDVGEYTKLADRAEAAGDQEVAAKYREIGAEEAKHHKSFKEAVSKALKPD